MSRFRCLEFTVHVRTSCVVWASNYGVDDRLRRLVYNNGGVLEPRPEVLASNMMRVVAS